ncbi:MAG: patatin family protein [Proteobacteria bacterium]|nr:patatin family protein [Pseudomonadota bacterium]
MGSKGIGVVCEGGGMRGIYTAGVLDVLGEHGVHFDGAVGTSAGAIHLISFLAGQHGRSVRFYLGYCRDTRFMGLRSWISTGDFVNYDFCYRAIPDKLVPFDYERFEASDTEFYVTCTDVETGQAVYHRTRSLRGEGMQYLRASASLPVFSKIVQCEGRGMLDGSSADSIPVAFLREAGFGRCVVILTRPEGFVKKPEMSGLIKMIYKKYPAFVKAQCTRHEHYNAELRAIEALEKAGEIFVFRPSETKPVRRLERNAARILEMYELGRRDALSRFQALEAFMAGK